MLREQLVHLRGTASDAATDAVVGGHAPQQREAAAARRDVDAHERLLAETTRKRAELVAERDGLLERLGTTEGS